MKKKLFCMMLVASLMLPSMPVMAVENQEIALQEGGIAEEIQQTTESRVIDKVWEYNAEKDSAVLVGTNVVVDEVLTAGSEKAKLETPPFASWDTSNGDISWGLVENGTGEYGLKLYKEGETDAFYVMRWGLEFYNKPSFVTDLDDDALENMTTGNYYFTIYAVGNNEYADSEPCKSNVFSYVRPEQTMAPATDLTWNKTMVSWKAEVHGGVAYILECCEEGSSDFKAVASGAYKRTGSITSMNFSNEMQKKGTYRFKIRILSPNIFEKVDSEWSEWSPVISSEELVAPIVSGLNDLLDNNAGANELLEHLEKQDTNDLAVSLQTDEAAREAIVEAEQKFAAEKGINVSSDVEEDMQDKLAGDVNIVGAAFNAGEDVKNMTLKITKPTVEVEVDKRAYKNAVQINMTLDGAADTGKLAVPVRITMPIPVGVESGSLFILHYHNDGSYEVIRPYITGNKASFTLTSFSTFVFVNTNNAPSEKPEEQPGNWPFTDVSQSGWKYEGIKYVYDNKIMNGVGDGTRFDPDAPLTREMFATVLYRMAGQPAVTYTTKFPDVSAGKWYSNAVIWASEQGIVSGYGDGSFGTGDYITREQIAKMLMEYGKMQGYDVSQSADFSAFADAGSVSGWANGYMRWAVGSGMIGGSQKDGKYYLNPKGNATRAESATMLKRFMEKY